ncbi:MAG: hypothetical protein F4Z97_02920 [Gammaproteobacteria bacterium]|nr:hypothetical protein [Gammaproteobacteria bacterium]
MVGSPPFNSESPRVSETCRIRWVRAFRLLFGCAWAVIAFASPVSADVLVSNIGQTTLSFFAEAGFEYGQGFVTGSNAAGYTLKSVELEFNAARNTSGLTVRLATGFPDSITVIATMTNPSSISVGANTFTAPSGTTLTAGTSYFIYTSTGAQGVRRTASDNEDSGAAVGWSIENTVYSKNPIFSADFTESTNALKIRINGTVKTGTVPDTTAPTLLRAVANDRTLTLTFSEALDTDNVPAASAFSISGAQSASSITAVKFRTGNSRVVDLTLNAAVGEGETGVTVTYTQPGTNDLQDGAANKVANFTRTVITLSEERIQTSRSILTTVGAQLLSSALENIGGRLGDTPPQTSLSLAGVRVPSVSGEPDDSNFERCHFDCRDQLDKPGYRRIDSNGILNSGEFSLNIGATEGDANHLAPHWSVWGRADFSSFEGEPTPNAHYDGNSKSGWFGIDARADSWIAGVALSRTLSETDYRLDASGEPERLKTSLTALYPYGRWVLDEKSALHAIVGIGSGEVHNVLDESSQEQSDLSMRMLSVGVRRQLEPFLALPEGMELSVRVEASLMRLKTQAGDENIDGLTPEIGRIRLGLEGSRRIRRDDGTVIVPFFDLSARRDSGDGLEGFGLEVAGGARYRTDRVQLEFRGRVLLTHTGRGVRESGLSVTAKYLPESDGRGLSLSFRPHWGIAANGSGALWRDEMPRPEQLSDASSFDARIGYGFDLPSTGGVVTPFAENIHRGDSRTLRVGTRFDAPRDNLVMQLAGEQHRNTADTAQRDSIRLDFSVRF